MRKVSENEFFKELFTNALFLSNHNKDSIYDFGTINELEKSKEGYHIEIFYRDFGTWMINHKSETSVEDQGITTMKRESIFSVDYIKQPSTNTHQEFDYYISYKNQYR